MLSLRQALATDEQELKRIGQMYANETILNGLSDEQLAKITQNCINGGIVLVAEIDNRIVGVIAGHFIDGFNLGKFCEEVIWYVEAEHRGIGLMLFERFLDICKEKGCQGIMMSAYNNEYLPVVDRLYRKQGFVEIDRRYYKQF